MKLKKITIAIALASLSGPTLAANSINTIMENNFNSMVNTTSAKAYNTARRGVFSGGSVFVKNEIKSARLATMTTPSISSGCGGIDIYGGSFSFINADQFVETFQAIGSNAIGYGLKLALQGSCNTCESIMTSLEKTQQFMNKLNIDSCTAAQGVVNAGVDMASGKTADVVAKTQGVASGLFSDFSESWASPTDTGVSATKEIQNANPTLAAQLLTGNVVWRAIKDANIQSIYSSETNFLEMLLSITGTAIFNYSSNDDIQTIGYEGHKITLEDMINGTTSSPVPMYKCDSTASKEACLTMSTNSQTFSDKGMSERVREAYVGSGGFIESLSNPGAEWSATAKQILGIPGLIANMCNDTIRTSVFRTPGNTAVAEQIALQCSSKVGLDIAYAVVSSYFSTLQPLLDNAEFLSQNEAALKKAKEIVERSRTEYEREYIKLNNQTDNSSILQLLNSYKASGVNVTNAKQQ
jgi:conjugative transfer pilus assembly protein TraH